MSFAGSQPDQEPASVRVGGSFRDPSGYVFLRGGRVFRAVADSAFEPLSEAIESGLLDELQRDGMIIGTRAADDANLRSHLEAEHHGFRHFLEHDVVPLITYPYEWSLSMLADAAVCTLTLQKRLAQAGLGLKDASAYNIQFVNGRPLFIDITSVERPARMDVWFALGQFQRMFLFPLLLARRFGWDLRSYFLANLDGRSLGEVAASLRPLDKIRPSLLLDITLPLLLEGKADRSPAGSKDTGERPRTDPGSQLLNLDRLAKKINALASGYRPAGVWAGYTSTCTYDDRAEAHKKTLVRKYLAGTNPAVILDLGCNTGVYSLLAAESGARVIAADGDPAAIEILYRKLQSNPAPISPMVVDLSNPSPAIGYMNQERASFMERAQGDCVLALALIHHLLVSGNLSLEAIRDMLYALTRDSLILEFVPTDDPMFQRLLRFRVDLFQDLTLDSCMSAFAPKFEILDQEPIAGSPRTLLHMRRKSIPYA